MAYNYPFEDFQEVWKEEPLIVLDTNAFLGLYRYSPNTANQFLSVMDRNREQIWIPAQVLSEFYNNHKDVVKREHNKYREVKKEIDRITENAKNSFEKQFIQFNKYSYPRVKELSKHIDASIESIREQAKKFETEVADDSKENIRMLKEDRVKQFFDKLVEDGNIGNMFTLSRLLGVYAEGENRYKYKIPPGYMDSVKDKDDETKTKKFGDLLLWKQLLEKAGATQKPIIFITLDEKEDWWVLGDDDQPISPRTELISEFREYSNKPFAMMSLSNFYNHASVLNNMVDNRTYLEMNSRAICYRLLDQSDWHTIADDNLNLTTYLIHGGDLQEYVDNPLQDVEVEGVSSPDLLIESVYINENHVNIEGKFTCEVEASITEAISSSYHEDYLFKITISGSISFEFEVDLLKKTNFIINNSLFVNCGGFEVIEAGYIYDDDVFDQDYDDSCVKCANPVTVHFTNHGESVCERCSTYYETCPECGTLFEEGTLGGAFCVKCIKNR
ncbi:PIN domain-containing protein [Paenibacillus lignilyticus]|uniref:DUF4935 domain-containing protein n=1 Tax=Paenibacillus lignilyticus TaxID=1172615 RepID=A0ABS5CL00_9BACL|nr:PIN domain-containing protein [Paenibacillus lignilyticus]MBP3966546.1 DUF4935 domain-containing protein [Paenibacillus lignilyticus]